VAQDEPDPQIGKVLQGRYKILELIASGGMGVVYRGERIGLGRAVAIKFVWPWIAQEEHTRKRFQTEAKAMSRLSHPSCVGVIDFGVEDGMPYLVMDFASGRTLGAMLQEGPLPVGEALHITRQILSGLAHAHTEAIIHRDIKPDNIVVTETSGFGAQVRILDFGLAKLKDTVSNMTQGFALGTPSYMAPEQTSGDPVDPRTDIYAVGVLLFEMLTGKKPFRADHVADLLKMHREKAPPTLKEAFSKGKFSPALEEVVARALAKSPKGRFASAAQFAAALDATPEAAAPKRPAPAPAKTARKTAAKPRSTKKAPAAAAREAAPKPRRRLRLGWAIGTVAVLAVGGAGTWWVMREMSANEAPANESPANEAPASQPATAAEGAPASKVERSTEPKVEPNSEAKVEPKIEVKNDTKVEPKNEAKGEPESEAPNEARAELKMEPKATAPARGETARGEHAATQPSQTPPASSPAHAANVPGLDEAKAMVRAGRDSDAIVLLRKLRAKYPNSAEVAYVQGNVYFDRMWWSYGFDSYRAAVRLDPAYRQDRLLIGNVMKSFISNRWGSTGERFIEREIGAAAIPYLREATRSNSMSMRNRASRLLARLEHR
jgi:eukaryotic-like serine/threonine-protein kinase